MHRTLSLLLLVAASLSASAGCSPPDGRVAGTGGSSAATSRTISLTTPTLMPGDEQWWCAYQPGPGGTVSGFSWSFDGPVHHIAMYRTKDGGSTPAPGFEVGKLFPCFDSDNLGNTAALAATIVEGLPSGTKPFTEGTGLPFGKDELVVLQLHALNTGTTPEQAHGEVTLDLADSTKPVTPLGTIQFYTPYIYVPSHASALAHERCHVPVDIDVQYSTTHQHSSGVGVGLFLDPPSGVPATTPFLFNANWDAPAAMSTPVHVPAGSSLRVECNYNNTTNADRYQGESRLTDEMCMMIGYYAPSQGDFFNGCIPEGLVPGMGVGDNYGTGSATCADTLACVSACTDAPPAPGDGEFTVGHCWQKCLTTSCPAASAPFHDLYGCVTSSCASACAAGFASSACTTCAASSCGAQLSACQSAGC